MRRLIPLLFPLLLVCASAQAKDEFAKVRCDGDIVQALKGQRISNGRVMETEARHEDIRLESLGGEIVGDDADDMGSYSWKICGREFTLLEKRNIIRDVIEFPEHSKAAPAFAAICTIKGVKTKDEMFGVLDISGAGHQAPVKAAWRIDVKAAKFVKMDTTDLLCPCDRSGIRTIDGGL